VQIIEARAEHIPAITEIYNDAIDHSVATFDTQHKTVEEQKAWVAGHGKRYPMLVAVVGDEVIGWASLSAYSDRCAYADTVEISLYVRDGFRGKGVGRELTGALLQAGREAGLHTVVARIESSNEASIHIFKTFGFSYVGVMREVGYKFGRLLDVTIMQLIYRQGVRT
jgi:phosphinothricin acetyltransferase